jgi:hypothetical protein
MPIFNLVLNSTNVIGTNNTTFLYKFIQGSFDIKNADICISQLIIPYSWFNISSSYYQNAVFGYYWVDGSYHSITLPDGFYQISDINQILYQYQITNNHYLINNTTGQYQVYITIVSNVSYYSNQIICQSVPTSLPTGYTPASGFVYSTSGQTPQVNILNNNFQSILGFTYGLYPPTIQTSSYNVLSNTTPNLTPVNSIIVCCDLISNECTSQSNILDTFYPNSSFASNISYTPSYEKWITMTDGKFNSLTIQLYDQNFRIIPARDPNITISLLIKQDNIKQKIERILKLKKLDFNDENQEE